MNHESYRELLLLSIHGELEGQESVSLEDHLTGCVACREERESLTRFAGAVAGAGLPEPPDFLLWQARQRLRRTLERSGRLRLLMKGLIAASLLLASGVTAGYLLFSGKAGTGDLNVSALQNPEFSISRVRFLETEAGSNTVELSFDMSRRIQMQGHIDDPAIQKILAYALINGQNPGIRLRAASVIGSRLPDDADADTRAALISAMKTDPNPAVRERALGALDRYAFDAQAREALLYVLQHDLNPKLRIEAINRLETRLPRSGSVGTEVLSVLQEKVSFDDNDYIRLRAKALLQEVSKQ